MSVERKVKPSKKAVEASRKKRIYILKIVGAIVGCIAILVGVFLLGKQYGVKSDVDAQGIVDEREKQINTVQTTKIAKMKRINYNGGWYDGPNGMYHVFIPGEPSKEHNYASDIICVYQRDDYDKTLYAAYGVMTGLNRYHEDFTDNVNVFLDEFNLKLAVDAMISTGGTMPDITWNTEGRTLDDGTHVLYVEGVFKANVSYYDEKQVAGLGTNYEKQEEYRFLGYLYNVHDYPVFCYTLYNPENFFADHDVPYYIGNVLSTFFVSDFVDNGEGYVNTSTAGTTFSTEEYAPIEPLVPEYSDNNSNGLDSPDMYKDVTGMYEYGDNNIPVDYGPMFYVGSDGIKHYIDSADEAPQGTAVEYDTQYIEVDFDKVTINPDTHVVRDSETNELIGWYSIDIGKVLPIKEEFKEHIKS